jgi:uncharacterized protein YciI
MPYYVVVSEQGNNWNSSHPMREQTQWTEHAAWVNTLRTAGVILLAGPLGAAPPHRALLIVHSENEVDLRGQFAEDPWVQAGILQTISVDHWKILASNDKLDPVLAEIAESIPSA